jgi:hypothetical protein
MTPLSSQQALDAFYLEARCRLLDLAAILDRIGRGGGAVPTDPRMQAIRAGLEAVLNEPENRAEAVQRIFSLPYDPAWPRPSPR